MPLPNIFTREVTQSLIQRISNLHPDTRPGWGKMGVAEMLAHCNVTYEMAYENVHQPPNLFFRLLLKFFVKKTVISEAPYKRNNKTAPAFLIKETRDFETEKRRLVSYIEKTQQLGETAFDNRPSLSFGVLNKTEWNNMFYKHLDHHLTQFGV